MGEIGDGSDILLRIHSECFTGDVLGSLRCDCGEQLDRALQRISEEGRGVIVYMRQEGRGIGLSKKIEAYNLQDAGHDTVEANILLGHQADEREYSLAARILEDLGVHSVRLMTNNPLKIRALESEGVQVVERIVVPSTVHPENQNYLRTKARRMDHMLTVDEQEEARTAGKGG
jgi:GTP cyclohydrolase II